MKTSLQIDWCPVERLPELQTFIDVHWKRGHILSRDDQLLRWQHPRRMEPKQLNILIAEDAAGIQGMLGVIPIGFNDRGVCRRGAMLALWVVTETMRPRGLGLHLLRRVMADDNDFVGTLGANVRTTIPILRALHYAIWPTIPRWTRVFDYPSFNRLLDQGGQEYAQTVKGSLSDSPEITVACPGTTTFRLIPWSDDVGRRWDGAWNNKLAMRARGTWRDADYLRWRYHEHPRYRYDIQFVERASDGDLAGLLVSRFAEITDRQERVLRIVEFLAEEGADDTLAREVVRQGESGAVAFADFYCTSRAFATALERVGFTCGDPSSLLPALLQPLVCKSTPLNGAFYLTSAIARDSTAYFSAADCYFTRSDGDQDRPN